MPPLPCQSLGSSAERLARHQKRTDSCTKNSLLAKAKPLAASLAAAVMDSGHFVIDRAHGGAARKPEDDGPYG